MDIPSDIQRRVSYWLTGPFDPQTKEQLRELQHHPQALIDAFFCDLSFGTGGLRALMGPGTNRLNPYTIRLATQGLANYLHRQHKHKLSVVIGYDSRHHSQEFAYETARVLAGNGIRAYAFSALRPTPYLSFACRFKKASAAVMITASHNPKEYNGYKVYWDDGAQIVAPHDSGIIEEMRPLKDLSQIHLAPPSDPLIETIPVETLDKEYLQAIAPLQHFPTQTRQTGSQLHLVYTSLHGTGITLIPQALQSWGFSSLRCVEDQSVPDGDFPTVSLPNPEDPSALEKGIALLEASHSDLLLASDPDADRLGVVVMHQGKPIRLNGNELACLCAEYIGTVLTNSHKLPPKGAFVTTIVTTELLKKIASAHGIALVEVLTGFKYIGEKIHLWETQSDGYQFLFGAEESYGYLLGTHARDKDAVVTSCLVAEMALQAKLQKLTLVDCLEHLYKKYGLFREMQSSLAFPPGKVGMDRMQTMMSSLRRSPPHALGTLPVLYSEDYLTHTRTYLDPHRKETLKLPASDVLMFRLKEGSRLVIRPSGTEPKLKIYASTSLETFSSLQEGIAFCETKLRTLTASLKEILNG